MLIPAGKSAGRVEPDSIQRSSNNVIVRVNILPRKSAKLNPNGTRKKNLKFTNEEKVTKEIL